MIFTSNHVCSVLFSSAGSLLPDCSIWSSLWRPAETSGGSQQGTLLTWVNLNPQCTLHYYSIGLYNWKQKRFILSSNMSTLRLVIKLKTCSFVSRLLGNGYSMLEYQTLEISWVYLKLSTAPGSNSPPYLVVRWSWLYAGETKCNCSSLFFNYLINQINPWGNCLGLCHICLSFQEMANVCMEASITPSPLTTPRGHVSKSWL